MTPDDYNTEDENTDKLLEETSSLLTKGSAVFENYIKEEKEKQEFKTLQLIVKNHISDKFYASKVQYDIANYIVAHQKILTLRDAKNPEMWIYHEGYYKPHGETYIQEFLFVLCEKFYKTSLLSDILAKVRAMTYKDADELFGDQHVDYVCLQNGIFNLRTKTLQNHSSDFIFFNKLPVIYDDKASCPAFLEFIKTTVSHHDIPVIQELFGFCLYRRYFIKKAVILSGSGSNGKSKIIEPLVRMIGEKNVCQKTLQQLDGQNFAKAELFGKMANIVGELSAETLKNTETFKSITGGDPIQADRKHRSQINFVNYAKQVFCANQLPITMDVSQGFFDRWILIEFPNRFIPKEEYDKLKEIPPNVFVAKADIIQKIITQEEINGIFNWSIEGLHRLFEKESFSYSLSSEEVKIKWLRTSNSLAGFILDNCVEENEKFIHKSAFKKAYIDYCRTHKLKFVTDEFIKKYITTNHSVQQARKGAEGIDSWEGIRLKNLGDQLASEKKKLFECVKTWYSQGKVRADTQYYLINNELLESAFDSITTLNFYEKGILAHVEGKAGLEIGSINEE